MVRTLSVGQLRVQTGRHGDGREAYAIFDSVRGVHGGADRYLAGYACTQSDRTYAYLLVDHLRWLEHEGLTPEGVGFGDLERYMGAIGAKIAGPCDARQLRGSAPRRVAVRASFKESFNSKWKRARSGSAR